MVAIATPPGRSGIGVVRLSGLQALAIVSQLTRMEISSFTANQARHLQLFSTREDRLIDDVVITYFKAPRSFTGEDVIEISGHGNPLILADIVAEIVSC